MVEVTKTARSLIGVVTSDKMNKSIIVTVVSHVKHPLYGKYLDVKRKWLRMMNKIHAKLAILLDSETRPIS